MKPAARALRHRNFRLFFTGQSISLIGTWIQQVAMSWLVYRLTGSAWLLGVTGFASQFPILLLAPVAGLWSDRFNRQRLLIATQSLAMLQAFFLAFLTAVGVVRVWHIIALAVVLGIANAFDTPVRQSFLSELVDDRRDLPNAIALNSLMMNAGRLIGPSIAGIMIAAISEAACFFINGVSYLAVIAAVLKMRLAPKAPTPVAPPFLQSFHEGLAYARRFAPTRILLPLLALLSFVTTPYMTLMPIVAGRLLAGGAYAYGFLVGAAGLGALAGTFFLAARHSVRGLGKVMVATSALAGGGLMLFALSPWLALSLGFVAAVGFGIIVTAASTNMILQTVIDDDKRGRVMSFYTVALLGMTPLGSLAGGAAAEAIGVRATLFLGGACCLGIAWVLTRQLPRLREEVRPIYAKLGILP